MPKDTIAVQTGARPSFGDQLPPKQVSWRSQMAQFVVVVDGQAKSAFDAREQAEAEAGRIRTRFPKLQVKVIDWGTDSVRTLGPTRARPEAEAE